MENNSAVEYSNESEINISENQSGNHIHKLLDDKNKARNYIKSCKNIMKKQSDQLKKQQNEFKNAVSTLETQSFTTRFHSVAFKLELDVMRLINIRRRVDCVIKKKFFIRFVAQTWRVRFAEYNKLRGAYAMIRLAGENIGRYLKNKKRNWLRFGFLTIFDVAAAKNPNSFRAKLENLKKDNNKLKTVILDTGNVGSIEELVEENKKLKEKLKTTEISVGNFIKEMGNLLNSHEPPGFFHESESPKPLNKLKKGKKLKARIPLVSPDRIEFPARKHKTTRVNFD